LFSTASDLAVFAQMMLNGGQYGGTRIIADSTVSLFTTRAARTRALGWDTCAGDGSCGKYLSERAYGHTGFTGTSLWIDPDRDMFVILLTNRVHAARARRPAKVISDVRADLSDAAALAVMDYGDGMLEMPAKFRADRAIGWNRPERVAKSRHSRVHTTVSAGRIGKSSSAKSRSKASTSKAAASKSPHRKSAKRPVKKPAAKHSTKRVAAKK
jgi:CubicO group peptidase (beta-lactamase class C family)